MAALDFSGQATPVKLPDFSASATPVDTGPPLTLSVKPTASGTPDGASGLLANLSHNKAYAKPGPYFTKLAPDQEKQFRQWVEANHVNFDPDAKVTDYDMRGFWLAQQQGGAPKTEVNQYDHKLHFTDEFKTPYDRTFSNQSRYAQPNAPHWVDNRYLVNDQGQRIFDQSSQNEDAPWPEAAPVSLGDLLPTANVLAGQPAAPALDMSNLGTPAETARALGEQFVGGGGQLLDKVQQFLQSDAGRGNTGPVGAALADLIADRGKQAEEFAGSPEQYQGIVPKVAGTLARGEPTLAFALAAPEAEAPGITAEAAPTLAKIPGLLRVARTVAEQAPRAGALTALQENPDATPAETARDLAVNAAVFGAPGAVGKTLETRVLSGGGIGALINEIVSRLEGQTPTPTSDLAMAMQGALGGAVHSGSEHAQPVEPSAATAKPEVSSIPDKTAALEDALRKAGFDIPESPPAASPAKPDFSARAEPVEPATPSEPPTAPATENAAAPNSPIAGTSSPERPIAPTTPAHLAEPIEIPDLAKPLHEMNGDELEAQQQSARDIGKQIEDRVLGDNAESWRMALRQRDSSDPAISARGERRLEEIESGLSEPERNALYGIGLPEHVFDEARDFSQAQSDAEVQSPGEASEVLARYLQRLSNTPEGSSPADWTREQQVAYSAIRRVQERIAEEGWNSRDIQKRAVTAVASRFRDPRDAEIMLGRFLKPQGTRKTEPATQRLQDDDTPEPPLEIRYGRRREGAGVSGLLGDRSRPVSHESEPPATLEEPRELTDADLSPAEREAFQRQRNAQDDADLAESMRTDSMRRGEQEAAQRGMPEAVQQALGDNARVRFVHDEDGLPENVQGRLKPLAEGNIRKGAFDPRTGEVYLFTRHVKDAADAVWTAAHEIAGHKGFRALVNDRAGVKVGGRTPTEALAKAHDMALQNPTVAKLADVIGEQRESTDRRTMAEEAMAELQAASVTGRWEEIARRYGVDVPKGVREGVQGAIRNFVARIKRILNALYAKATGKPEPFTDEHVHAMLAQMREHAGTESRGEGAPLEQRDVAPLLDSQAPQDRAEAEPSESAPEPDKALPRSFVSKTLSRLIPGLDEAASAVRMAVTPMAEGSVEARATAKDFANQMREARYRGNFADTQLTKNFSREQLEKMWNAADEQSVLEQKGEPTAGKGLDTLAPDERRAVEILQANARKVFDQARALGMVEGEGLPSYTPRMVARMGETGPRPFPDKDNPIAGNVGRNVRTTTGQLKQRLHLTAEETEAAAKAKLGEDAELVRNIRTLPLATAKLSEAVAGRALINRIRDIGKQTGQDTVREGSAPDDGYRWFTIQHPAFTTWRPRFETDPETGKTTAVTDENGNTVFDRVPLYVRGDFAGPLKAVLSEKNGPIYNGLMSLKGKTMSVIMYSPLIHNAVEWGRALPAMPGKVATFRVYFEGNRAKNDPVTMREAINAGLVPIGHRYGFQDISSIQESNNIIPGRSWTAKLLAAVPNLFDKRAGDAVKRAVDALGDVWHNKLLWDRVGDLQMGLYTNFRDHLIHKAFEPDTAQRMAAHFANRYAGALPLESMSNSARKIANLMLFSRSFTLGNLGAMKDMVSGLPRDVQSQILRDRGLDELARANAYSKRKAISIIAADMALMYLGNSLLQSGIAVARGTSTLQDEEREYGDRLAAAFERVKENPLALLHPFDLAESLTPMSGNEPGKEDRVLVGRAPDGTAIYMRNPVGKIGEEFKGWMTSPLDMLKRKLGTIARPVHELITNDKGFGRKVYDPYDGSTEGMIKNAGRIAWLFVQDQVPTQSISAVKNAIQGKGDTTTNVLQAAGPLAGLTFSKGAPGGPAVGIAYQARDEHDFAVNEALPDIRDMIRAGDTDKAVEKMRSLGMPPGYIRWVMRTTENPSLRLSPRGMRDFSRYASPEQQQAMQDALDGGQ